MAAHLVSYFFMTHICSKYFKLQDQIATFTQNLIPYHSAHLTITTVVFLKYKSNLYQVLLLLLLFLAAACWPIYISCEKEFI